MLVCERQGEFGHALDLHVAMLELPLVIGLHEGGADQSRDAVLIREDTDHICPALHLLVQPLERVCNRYEYGRCPCPAAVLGLAAYGATIRDRGTGSTKVRAGRYTG